MNTSTDTPLADQRAADKKAAFEINKLSKRLHRQVGQAITDFNMIEDGDRVMVCLSGGKDSYGLLDVLLGLQQRAPIRFSIVAVNLDQKQPGFPADILPAYLKSRGVEFHIENQDTYSIVKRLIPEGQTMCSLCSRLRRGILYRVAGELGATKIALGHHRDDFLGTVFLNMFFGGKLKGMPPKLVSDDGRNTVIRPLAYVAETDLESWAEHRQFPIIPCSLCGNQENLQRVQMKKMLREWDRNFPGRIDNLHRAFSQLVPSHLMDRKLFPFETIRPTGVPDAAGDKAFDEDDGEDDGDGEGCAKPPAAAAVPAVATIAMPVPRARRDEPA
ncbi:tRNA 2-thiocytidine(32) synthetase TtcA [Sphaerotilus mobilis]|uniref:tRNA-cytidine(32) 2-sulfurtransferase n=1 Tax=Sphaerotilus mobilis TaxID=47994 RepID=A0A4Q7LL00_9BURK|nr:tRNA 2-thiocytidine(32) synthetase TtcA [Sphaerotilus mobilis]RZS54892.1 tRNA s(2)C-32 sulfurtransferase [Sphaerotilus mobilis]